jgi:hypothetical protein
VTDKTELVAVFELKSWPLSTSDWLLK